MKNALVLSGLANFRMGYTEVIQQPSSRSNRSESSRHLINALEKSTSIGCFFRQLIEFAQDQGFDS